MAVTSAKAEFVQFVRFARTETFQFMPVGGPALREWADDANAAPGDLDALAGADEAVWLSEAADLQIY